MRSFRGLVCLIAVAALFARDTTRRPGDPAMRRRGDAALHAHRPRRPGDRRGRPSPSVSEVGEVMPRTPSKIIFCSLTRSEVRCDIVHKSWTPPSKPSDCELDWGNGLYIAAGKAGLTCTGDTLIGSARDTLEYGRAYRSGTVLCDSENSGLTCRDEQAGRGFTLAVARYSFFDRSADL